MGAPLPTEVQNYYTDYFVRIEGNISALVTVSYYRTVEADGSALAAAITRRLHMIGGSTGQDQPATGMLKVRDWLCKRRACLVEY